MKVLLIGSGHYYIHKSDIRCIPKLIRPIFMGIITNKSNEIVHLDISKDVEPDIIADVSKYNWWNTIDDRYDIIIDTIGHLGPHINHGKVYCSPFRSGCLELLKKR